MVLLLPGIRGTRVVVHCKLNPAGAVGHFKRTCVPARVIVRSGPLTGASERLNTEPLPLPPRLAVPYKVLADKTNVALGLAPSLAEMKLCRFVKAVPFVLSRKMMPL